MPERYFVTVRDAAGEARVVEIPERNLREWPQFWPEYKGPMPQKPALSQSVSQYERKAIKHRLPDNWKD